MINQFVATDIPGYTKSLINRIKRKEWWRMEPMDEDSEERRGRFYSSSFDEAEFYGHPGDPERVVVNAPLIGDNLYIEMSLLGSNPSLSFGETEGLDAMLKARYALDARIKKAAVAKGFDSVALLTLRAWIQFLQKGTMPRSIELNTFFWNTSIIPVAPLSTNTSSM